jgi:hypothetical protein
MGKLSVDIANDHVLLSRVDDVCSISCPSAVIRTSGNAVFFADASPATSEKRCTLEVEREVLGTAVRDSVPVPRVFALFGPALMTVSRFPAVVEWRFDLLCLGASDGRLLLRSPQSLDWCWLGKTRHALRGPQKLSIVAGILASGPVRFDVADFLSVVYGNETRPLHHTIAIVIQSE